jgi:hypothetical protein
VCGESGWGVVCGVLGDMPWYLGFPLVARGIVRAIGRGVRAHLLPWGVVMRKRRVLRWVRRFCQGRLALADLERRLTAWEWMELVPVGVRLRLAECA